MEDIMKKITEKLLEKFKEYLYEEEKSTATINTFVIWAN